MVKATVYLPIDLNVRLEAESTATGISKAELIRRGIAMMLESSTRPKRSGPLPIFTSGRPLSPEQMGDEIYAAIKEGATRR